MSPAALRVVESSSMDKSKALEAALTQIERAFGKGSIMKLGKNDKTMDIDTVSTGSLGLDIALGVGGLPRGRVVEIYGPESSGKTTLALHCLAEAQKAGGICAFIDAEHALDPIYARKLGVKVDDLLISQPDHGEQALEIADTLVRSGAIDILVVDSVAKMGEIIDLGVKAGVVEKSGSWFSYDSQRIGQGRENAKTFLKANPDIATKIEAAIRANAGLIAEKILAGPEEDDKDDDAAEGEPVSCTSRLALSA